ncbi:MAG: hypothetical protein WBB48_10360 [Thermodesulfobacteriota bacterium]
MSTYLKFSMFSFALTFLFMTSNFTTSALAQNGEEGSPNTVFAILAEPPALTALTVAV